MKNLIESIWNDRELLKIASNQDVIRQIIEEIDKGKIRVANQLSDGNWQVNDWVKKAVILYFPIQQMEVMELKPFEFHDKMKLNTNLAEASLVAAGTSVSSIIPRAVFMAFRISGFSFRINDIISFSLSSRLVNLGRS
jgi:2,3,4,5-tetrahydropyridine-2,6-dicarboxylate N-succinyltransferase